MVDSVAEIGVSNLIPVLVPPLQDSRSYESGQNAGRQIGREWTAPATIVDKMPVGDAGMMRAGAEGRNPGLSAAQSPSSPSAVGLGEVTARDAWRRRWARAIIRARMRSPRRTVSRSSAECAAPPLTRRWSYQLLAVAPDASRAVVGAVPVSACAFQCGR